ncbi:MAG: hypothetical protein ACRDRX_15420 [Pseudonocardiaceae bacterium]
MVGVLAGSYTASRAETATATFRAATVRSTIIDATAWRRAALDD